MYAHKNDADNEVSARKVIIKVMNMKEVKMWIVHRMT